MGEIYPEDENKEQPKKSHKGPKPPTILDQFGTNVSKLADEDKLDPVVGRTEEIARMVQILGRRRKNNPVLVGEPGVGKTAIVEGLAMMIRDGRVPRALKDKIIYTLELTTIIAGTKYRGQFEERMKAIIDELKGRDDIIVFIDELHNLVGAGSSSGSMDASNIVKPALARGEIRCIGATTFDEFRENIEGDGALDRRFQKVTVDPASPEETLEILYNIRHKYEGHHRVKYTDEIIQLIVKMADRYISDRFFPDKAVDIVDEVGSYKNLTSSTTPDDIKKMEKRLFDKNREKKRAVAMQDYEKAAKIRDECKKIELQIYAMTQRWEEELLQNAPEITADDVLKVLSKLTGVPLEKIGEEEHKALLGLNDHLKSRVIGQPDAIDKISTAIQRNRIGIRRKNRTVGNFILLGSTGTGKTFLAKEIAEYMFGGEDSMIRVDMSEYMEPHSVSKLIGSPPGYVGHDDGGQLTEKVRRKPHSLILFDEIEKANPLVFNVMLQMLDDGHLTDGMGRRVDFRNCLIIMTSNTGTRELEEFGTGIGFNARTVADTAQMEKDALMKAMKKRFAPEFLNRIDEIVIFNKLKTDDVEKILELELQALRDNLAEMGGYKLRVSPAAKQVIIEQGYDDKYGARQLARTIESLVENRISELVLKGELAEGGTIGVKAKNGEVTVGVG
jgi:ATP-dependent Clp protease ATP-binding subunit ClpC